MLDKTLIQKLDFKDPAIWLTTWFGCGLMKPAPGTWGTLGGLPFGIFLMLGGGWKLLMAGTIVLSLIGYRAAEKFEKTTGTHDFSAIVVDEVAGIWLTLLAAVPTPLSAGLAFVLFRFFDILKPWPVSWCDQKIPGGAGVMIDDLAAGLYAALCLWGLRHAGIG